ncbi:MAG: ureidoglycolate lyase [Phyllobacterium sp.]
MSGVELAVRPLSRAAFAPFGDVIETAQAQMHLINGGMTQRFHDLARVEAAGDEARVLVNIFRGRAFAPPIEIGMLERHPLGSQAFVPLGGRPFLAVVAGDEAGRPGMPVAFLCQGNQGVNYHRNVWHHPLIALDDTADFLVVDRGGAGNNLEEFFFDGAGYRITRIA